MSKRQQPLEYVLTDDRIGFIANAIITEYENEFNTIRDAKQVVYIEMPENL